MKNFKTKKTLTGFILVTCMIAGAVFAFTLNAKQENIIKMKNTKDDFLLITFIIII